VTDCANIRLGADRTFLDVTLRNTRAIQHHSFIFAGAYPEDLSGLLHSACRPLPLRPSTRPQAEATGHADSQNMD
jgi:hypothetical protein